MKKRTAAVLAAFLIPYITTLAVSGRVQGADGGKIGGNSDRTSGGGSQTDDRQILLDREDVGRNNGTGYAVPLEEYLIGLTAVQIPDGYPKEAVKAQAILARTALYREMDGADSIEESALDMDYLEPEQIESRFEALECRNITRRSVGRCGRAQDRRRYGMGIILSRCFMQ